MTTPQPVKCGHCLGRGKIRDNYHVKTEICPTCGGSGKVRPR